MSVHNKRGHRLARQILPVAGGAPIPLPQKVPPAETAIGDSDPLLNDNTPTIAAVKPTTAPALKPTTAALTTAVLTKPTVLSKPTTSALVTTSTSSTVSLVTTRPRPTTTAPISSKSSSVLSSSVASASASSAAKASGGMSTGALVGGIAAGVVALLGLIGLVAFLLRRWRKRNQHAAFNAAAFRRQSTALVDNDHGLNYGKRDPRPPSMIERKMNNTPTSSQPFGQHPYGQQQQPQYDQPQYDQPQYDYQPQYPDHPVHVPPPSLVTHDIGRSLSPGHAMNSPATSVPASPSSGAFFPNPYGQLPNSPLHSPISPNVGHYESQYHGQRQTLLPSQAMAAAAAAPRVNSVASDEYDFTAHYVDLDRSSVTPYQAAQYAEISRRLNDGDSNGQLLSVPEGQEEARTPTMADFPAVPAATHYPQQQQQKRRSLTSVAETEGPFSDPHLQPPSPSFARQRIASKPPMLPEIERGSGYDFPVSARPSPRAAFFTIPGQDGNNAGGKAQANGQPGPTARVPIENADKKRPDSLFANDDAYGGI